MKIYFNKLIKSIDINGIKCDCCDFKDTSVNFKDYELWVNKHCPKCNSNLLTPKDLSTILLLITIKKWFGWIRIPSFFPPAKVKLKMNGTGKIAIEKKKLTK